MEKNEATSRAGMLPEPWRLNKISVTLEVETNESIFDILKGLEEAVKTMNALPTTEKIKSIKIKSISSDYGMTLSFDK